MTRRVFGLLLGLAIVAAGVVMPPPEGLTIQGFRALLLLAGAIVLWVLQPVDLAVTALLGLAGLPLLGILPAASAFELFSNQAVFFVMGVFLLAAVLTHTGLAARLALTLLSRFDRSPAQLSTAVLVLSTVFCGVMVSHVVAAVFFPILLEICRALSLPHGRSPYARRLLLSMSWGTIVGSNLTFLSSVRVGLALGLLHQHNEKLRGGEDITFAFWLLGASVVVLAMLGAATVVLHVFHRPERIDMRPAVELLQRRITEMGPMRRDEWVAAGSVVVMLVGMVLVGDRVGFGTVALTSACLSFLLGSVSFEKVEKYVSWGIILLFGGAVAMATALEQTGAVEWLAEHLLPTGHVHPVLLVAVVAYGTVLMSEFASNTAVIAALLPVCMVLAEGVGLQPRIMVFATVIPAGLAFMLPTGTPAMAMVFSSGYLRTRDSVLPGVVLIHLGWISVILAASFWWPLIGLR
ncbi:MAG: DASS family sodium-coupled anion symporter [Deltaproteobacteria bacterium]|nr:DASS family sodium-coupled anion symporter [Deltaproteobacteria bacterium]